MTGCELLWILRVSLVQRNHAVSMINVADEIVNILRIITLISDKRAASQRQILFRFCKKARGYSAVRGIGRGCDLGNRKSGNAVDQDTPPVPADLCARCARFR